VVETDLTAFALTQPVFNQLLETSTPFRALVFNHFADRVADLMQLVEEVAFGPLDQRLAAYLVGTRAASGGDAPTDRRRTGHGARGDQPPSQAA
jgi:CRP/FNR family transcriptional regulator